MVRVYVGPNHFALQKALKKHVDEFEHKHGNLAVEKYYGDEIEIDKIQSALESTSLFSSNKLVVVKSLGENKQADQVGELLDAATEESELLLIENKPDKRSNYYKTIKKHAQITEYKELDERELVDWMTSQAKTKDVELSRADAEYLINRVGNQQARINNELKKLFDFTNKIDKKTIDIMSEPIPQNTIFELLEAVFFGQQKRAVEFYENLRLSGSQPPMILSMIIWQLHLISLMAYAGSRTIDKVSSDSGIKPFPLRKSQALARRLGGEKIKNLFNELEALDYKLKTHYINADEAISNMLSRIAISSQ